MRLVNFKRAWAFGIVITTSTVCLGQTQTSQPKPGLTQAFLLTDTSALVDRNVKTEAVEYLGRKCVRVLGDPNKDGFALLKGVDFQDGTIEAEIALKVTTPPGVHMPGFVGIAFRAMPDATKPDTSKYELFYLRPGNSHAPDQSMRNHSVQYVSEPDHDWYTLRRNWPWMYESHAELAFEKWTKVRIEVAGREAKLFVNGDAGPALVVDGLKGESLHGGVALWGYAGEEAYFSNVKITPAAPVDVKNGSDIAGEWAATLTTDFGKFDGTMKLSRGGDKVSGEWTGVFGQNLPVTGTWRDGYVELEFPGNWTAENPGGNPGPITVTIAGWVDGNSAKGQSRVINRADGAWSAEKK
ncbi:hypothetical protein ACFPT7_17660 [Acidicapsa dinghuensis]|uniref:DUF1080 domain-containing protein n=1 Tax=Acidicapsa dinghuensis TaxID=2218256 RepID=A0ABW1EJ55_9BACT|nr:hypothetical protein [Acidicapsa dinghuensis]